VGWASPAPLNLRRKCVFAERRSSQRKAKSGPVASLGLNQLQLSLLQTGEAEAHTRQANPCSDTSAMGNGEVVQDIGSNGSGGSGALWDEEPWFSCQSDTQISDNAAIGLDWEILGIEGGGATAVHRTLLSGAEDSFDWIFS